MAETLFTDDVVIQGSRDITQLDIKGNSTQTQPLQKWETSGNVVKAQVSAEGRLQVGDNLTAGIVPDALIQANGDVTLPSSQVPSGLHTIGKVQGTIPGGTSWTTHELRLDGSGTVGGTQSTSRHKLTFGSTGDGTTADLRATDTQAINEKGTVSLRLGRLTAIRALLSNALNAFLDRGSAVEAAITNDTGGNINRAIGVNVPTPVNAGTIGQLYGVRVEDLSAAGGTVSNYAALSVDNEVEMKVQAATPTKLPPAGVIKIYPKLSGSNPKLYAKNAAGTEFDLSGGSTIYSPKVVVASSSASTNNDQLVVPRYVLHPDGKPVSPNSYDDEFEGTTPSASWSWVNQVGSVASVAGSHLRLETATGGTNVTHMFVRSAPITASWTITAKIVVMGVYFPYIGAGLCVRSTSSNTSEIFQQYFNNGVYGFDVGRLNTSHAYASSRGTASAPGPIAYQRLNFDGTNLIYLYSLNGYNYTTLFTLSATASVGNPLVPLGAINQVGLYVVGGQNNAMLSCDFFRVS